MLYKNINLTCLIIARAAKTAIRIYTPAGVVVVVVKTNIIFFITLRIILLYFQKSIIHPNSTAKKKHTLPPITNRCHTACEKRIFRHR